MPDALLSTTEAAARLKVSLRRVQALIKAGRLPATRVGGRFVIRESDLNSYTPLPPHRPRTKNPWTEPANPQTGTCAGCGKSAVLSGASALGWLCSECF